MPDGTGNAEVIRTVAEQMADAMVDAAWRRMKAEQEASAQRTASWPAWAGLAISVLTPIIVVSIWFGSVRSEIAHARDVADEAKMTAAKADATTTQIASTVVRIDENVKNLRAELGR